jgi:ribosomal protein S18 acetylase RimI-like enzyme
VIRDAGPDDLGAIAALHRRASFVWEDDAAALAAQPDALEPPRESGLDEGRVRVAVDASGAIIGFSVVLEARPGVWELDDLFVEPELMRRGVGRTLVVDLVERGRAAGVRRLEVTANPHALGFYERMGFLATGEIVATRFKPASRMALEL